MNKKVIGGIIFGVLLLGGLLWWAVGESSKPLPGQTLPDLGRDHITDITGIQYNSNPPTSGKHFPVWAKKGLYDRVLSDGYLLHSLEHGYVVISYDCTKLSSKFKVQSSKLISRVFAHEGEEVADNPAATESAAPLHRMNFVSKDNMSFFTPQTAPEKEVEPPSSFSSNECKTLISELSSFLNDWQRLIIVPRINLDVPVALTAWGKIEKLKSLDKGKIKDFISAYHNKGPEATVE